MTKHTILEQSNEDFSSVSEEESLERTHRENSRSRLRTQVLISEYLQDNRCEN